MTVPFQQIPGNLRVPLFWAEVDPRRANTGGNNYRALLIGGPTSAGTAVADTPLISSGYLTDRTLYGAGSLLAMMSYAYRLNDTFGELWCLPVADAGGAVAATYTLTCTGPSTAAGTLFLYIAGEMVPVLVTSGMAATALAAAIVAAVGANPNLPVTAGVAAAVVTLTAKNKGPTGNDIDVRLNYLGSAAGEATPAGIGVAIAAGTAGSLSPTLTTALANLGDQAFDFIACAWNDVTTIAALDAFLNDSTGRWSWQTQVYGHYFIAYRGTFGAATTFGVANNGQHGTCMPMNGSPTPPWFVAAAECAQAAISVRADAAQPIRDVPLVGVRAPPVEARYSLSQRNTLLFDGLSTFKVDPSGVVYIEKLITMYQRNAQGTADISYLDVETLFNLAFILRDLRNVVERDFSRMKLAADGTRLQGGSNVTTPSLIKAALIARYRQREADGYVQRSDAFAAHLIVQKNGDYPNRVDVLWPGTLIDRLDVLALLAQFRLS